MDCKPKRWLRLGRLRLCNLLKCSSTQKKDTDVLIDSDCSAADVKNNGWRQGSILSSQLVLELQEADILPSFSCNGTFVVVSHDCDITNHSFENEPNAEVIFGEKIESSDRKDGNKRWGKNSRMLQIDRDDEKLEFSANKRYVFPRMYLAKHKPAAAFETERSQELVCWIALRYNRRAFADEFNDRIKPGARKLRGKLKSKGDVISGMYLVVSDEELDSSEEYEVIFWASMREQDFENPDKRKKAMKLLGTIESEIDGCEGISIEEAELKSESEISISDIRLMKRWDIYNDLTLRDEGQDAIPPTPS